MLASPQAIEMGIHVVRAFVCMRALAATHDDLARRLAALEHKAETLALHHDQLQHDTHKGRRLHREPLMTAAEVGGSNFTVCNQLCHTPVGVCLMLDLLRLRQ